jgi:hypothetical protein
MNIPKKMDPEKSPILRAGLYAVGIGGIIHFSVLFVVAIIEDNFIWFNPLFAIDLDRIYPWLKHNALTFFGGWAFLAVSGFLIYKILKLGDR